MEGRCVESGRRVATEVVNRGSIVKGANIRKQKGRSLLPAIFSCGDKTDGEKKKGESECDRTLVDNSANKSEK